MKTVMNEKYILALGFFDGVHRGHQELLAQCRRLASETGAIPAAVTFDTHPDALVAGAAPALLGSLEDRKRLLKAFGAERVFVLPFDETTKNTPWEAFFDTLLGPFSATGLVCGQDFRFGKGGLGNAASLKAACGNAGIPCAVVPELTVDGAPVSSTRIRELLAQGRVPEANALLGHPHTLTGPVVPGRQLGRTLGIPTANLALPPELLRPKSGVYACLAYGAGKPLPAVVNIGSRPTVGGHHTTVEAWLLDFSGDLYGETLTLELYQFLRPERKFSDLAQLQVEIRRNAQQTREFFSETGKT